MATDQKKKSGRHSMIFIYLQSYFVTIATILGVGVLGLPVTLAKAGLYPFLVSFLIGAVAQALLIYFFVELLQIAYAAQNYDALSQREEMIPLNDMLDDESCDEMEHMDSNTVFCIFFYNASPFGHIGYIVVPWYVTGPVLAGHVIMPKGQEIESPSLYTLGSLFLGVGFKQCFEILLMLQFVGFLISYALAGSEAYAQVIGVDYRYVIPVFVWLCTFAIVFAQRLVQPVVSVLTFFKGSLLLGTVIITFIVGSELHREIHNDFKSSGEPFLMGTVALGGVINTMPLMYSKIKPDENQIKNFRLSVILGLMTCMVLNVLWCWAVLDIVPQMSTFPCDKDRLKLCTSNISLDRSESMGEISTIPLTEIINSQYPEYRWVSLLVESFIVVSITVSFLVSGAVLSHTVTGWLKSWWKKDKEKSYKSKESCINKQCVCNKVFSLFLFTVVFIVAMLDPRGFVEMLEKYSSLTLNLEAGLFVFLMMLSSRRMYILQQKIPLRMPGYMKPLQLTVPLYFGFAVVYDIYNALQDIISESSGGSVQLNSTVLNNSNTKEMVTQLNKLVTTTSPVDSLALSVNSTNFTNFFN